MHWLYREIWAGVKYARRGGWACHAFLNIEIIKAEALIIDIWDDEAIESWWATATTIPYFKSASIIDVPSIY